tara:strand:+ start:2474 stop:3157 length:684 start_codon:yes stop_codon:yes gene_type:complete
MNRFYFLKINLSEKLSIVKDSLMKKVFSSGSNRGFIIYKYREDFLSGRYVSSKKVLDVVETPFGELIENERLTFDFVDFEIFTNENPYMLLKNPSRSLNEFFNELNVASNYSLVVDDFSIKIEDFLNDIDSEECRLKSIKQLDLKNIRYSPSIYANLSLKGMISIDTYRKDIMEEKDHVLNKCKATFILGDRHGDVEIFHNGRVNVADSISNKFIEFFKSKLTNHLK